MVSDLDSSSSRRTHWERNWIKNSLEHEHGRVSIVIAVYIRNARGSFPVENTKNNSMWLAVDVSSLHQVVDQFLFISQAQHMDRAENTA